MALSGLNLAVGAVRFVVLNGKLTAIDAKLAELAKGIAAIRKFMLSSQRAAMLRLSYLDFIASVFPSFNNLRAGMLAYPQGFDLMVRHPFFSQYTFSSGPQAQAVFQWIVEHRQELDECHVMQVGVHSPEDSAAFFKLSPGAQPAMGSQGRLDY